MRRTWRPPIFDQVGEIVQRMRRESTMVKPVNEFIRFFDDYVFASVSSTVQLVQRNKMNDRPKWLVAVTTALLQNLANQDAKRLFSAFGTSCMTGKVSEFEATGPQSEFKCRRLLGSNPVRSSQ